MNATWLFPADGARVGPAALGTLASRHPIVDNTVALVLFLVALSVIGSAAWLAIRAARRNRSV